MTSTQNRRWIRSSFQDWLVSTFPTYHFNFGDKRTSLEDLLKTQSPIILVDWLKRGGQSISGARLIKWPVQLTVVEKSSSDQFGTIADGIVSAIVTALNAGRIPVYDYTDPTAPTDTGFKLQALNVEDDDVGSDEVAWAVAITAELNYIERK